MSEARALIAQLQQQHVVDETTLAARNTEKDEAADLIAQLQQQHEADEAALTGLRGEHATIRGTLEHTQMAHAGAQSELERLSQEASQTKAALAEELAAAQNRITLTAELDEQRDGKRRRHCPRPRRPSPRRGPRPAIGGGDGGPA